MFKHPFSQKKTPYPIGCGVFLPFGQPRLLLGRNHLKVT